MAFENARLYSVLQNEIVERRLAQTELSEASQRKDEFLAMLAHELRNPLAPIRNAAAVVRRLTNEGDARVSWALDVTERQVKHLARLVDELLDVARIGEGKIVLRNESVNLLVVIAQGIETVRDLFEQGARSLDRSQGGLGVGLTLVQRLVQLHHGTVEAHSEGVDRGASFKVVLPGLLEAAPAEHTLPAPGTGAAPAPDSRRVLVVEDKLDIAETIMRYLQPAGHEVLTANDGSSALASRRAYAPDVVILDIGLPGIDGFEVARSMRAMPECAHALLIAMTGYGQAADRQKTQTAGFDAHLVKPTDPEALVQLIGGWQGRGGLSAPLGS